MPFNDYKVRSDTEIQQPVEEKSERFQPGRVLTMAAGHAVHDSYTAFLPPLLPSFIARLALTKAEAGLLNVFITAPSLIQPAIGHLADRFNMRYLVIFAPAITATMMCLIGVAPGYTMLALFLLVAGFSSAGLHAVGPVMAGRLSGRSLGRGMSLWMVGGELGRTLGPIVVVTVVIHMSLKGVSWLMVGGWAASLVLFLRMRSVSGSPRHIARSMPWRSVVRRMKGVLLPLGGIILLRAFMQASLTYYLPTFMIEEGKDLWFAGASLTLLQAAGVGGALLGGSVSDWLGRRTVLLISMTVAPVLMFVFLASHAWVQFSTLLFLGFFMISTTPVMMALVQESFPENRALANGTYMLMSFVIRSGVIVLLGALSDKFGLRQAYGASAVIMLLGIPLVFMLPHGRSISRKV